MERLTREVTIMTRGKEAVACNYKNDDCNDYCRYGTCRWQEKANMLLKKYEDTGLAPEQIINLQEESRWIPVEERLPKEHDSIFAKWKGTDKWSKSMFEKTSGDVNVTVEYEDGKRKTITAHTVDGKWALPNRIIKQKVIAWRPLPDSYCPERSERK